MSENCRSIVLQDQSNVEILLSPECQIEITTKYECLKLSYIRYRIIIKLFLGFITPTSGTAYVNGFDIREDIASVRNSLGLCPQHDVLFDTLTVEEHLKFFAKVGNS